MTHSTDWPAEPGERAMEIAKRLARVLGWLAGGGLRLAPVLLLLRFALQKPPPVQVRWLPDRSRVAQEAVSPPGVELAWGPRWQRWLIPCLPPDTKSLLGTPRSICSLALPGEVIFWISQTDGDSAVDFQVDEVTCDGQPAGSARLCHKELKPGGIIECWRLKVPNKPGALVRVRFQKAGAAGSAPQRFELDALYSGR